MKLPFSIRSWRNTPALAAAAVALLFIVAVAAAWFGERDFREQKMEQAHALVRVLAASETAALAFDDEPAARQAMAALNANADVDAVGVYLSDGRLFASHAGKHGAPPAALEGSTPPNYRDGFADASAPVMENGSLLGYAYLRLSAGSAASRWLRYLGIALALFTAAVMLVVIANAQRALSEANVQLSVRASELAASNAKLNAEIAERRKAENALAQAQKMEAIGQLTGGIAHDFNNLLMVISSGLRLLATRDDEGKRASIVTAMQQAVDRGADLTKQLLAFSRRQKLSPEVILVEERLQSLRPLLERSLREDIDLRCEFDDTGAAAKVDPGQFDIAILNLAVNARDAMASGGSLTLRVRKLGDREVAVSVTDTGVGMSPETQARAFDPFFTTKEVGKGTGLGLSQVYGFAVQSGGRCEIDSEQNTGTTVTIVLPLSEQPPAQVKEREKTGIRGAGNVLVVEDDESVAIMVCESLSDLGYTSVRVSNAAEALNRIEEGAAVDVLFSDIIMPGGMNGVELAREVRRRRADLPIVLTTGYGGRGEAEIEGYPVLRKPYDRDELGAVLATVVSHNAANG